MAKLPTTTPTLDAIYATYKNSGPRSYLGGSQIGEECKRKLWYVFRRIRPPFFEGRILRLFQTGHREEDRMIADLRRVGCDVCAEQYEIVCCDGHMKGHFDGVVTGLTESPKTPHLLECKTMNAKALKDLLAKGVEESKPVHFAQMQLYGGCVDLTRFAYMVYCKDNDQLYLERGTIKKTITKQLIRKGQSIISAENPPDRPYKDPSFYKCKFCDFADYCWGEDCFPDVNCRTCVHSSPGPNGSWECDRGHATGATGCDEHLFIPGLLHWTKPVDGDEGWIKYEAGFINCAATGMPTSDVVAYSSEQLRALDAA